MRHFLFLLMCDSILVKANVKRPRYGLLTRNALHALYALNENLLTPYLPNERSGHL